MTGLLRENQRRVLRAIDFVMPSARPGEKSVAEAVQRRRRHAIPPTGFPRSRRALLPPPPPAASSASLSLPPPPSLASLHLPPPPPFHLPSLRLHSASLLRLPLPPLPAARGFRCERRRGLGRTPAPSTAPSHIRNPPPHSRIPYPSPSPSFPPFPPNPAPHSPPSSPQPPSPRSPLPSSPPSPLSPPLLPSPLPLPPFAPLPSPPHPSPSLPLPSVGFNEPSEVACRQLRPFPRTTLPLPSLGTRSPHSPVSPTRPSPPDSPVSPPLAPSPLTRPHLLHPFSRSRNSLTTHPPRAGFHTHSYLLLILFLRLALPLHVLPSAHPCANSRPVFAPPPECEMTRRFEAEDSEGSNDAISRRGGGAEGLSATASADGGHSGRAASVLAESNWHFPWAAPGQEVPRWT
ncbi:hypothetical protein C7M84_013346 [Penaeus vannamei]|uniref:Uncharacterized protein n=1 Tax=Penaeus vannamei TaxID=6689 RepID=A0A423SWJ2_PENVA|nr:hypothetical protein C7M84_013346 [Penaeus vannamei]